MFVRTDHLFYFLFIALFYNDLYLSMFHLHIFFLRLLPPTWLKYKTLTVTVCVSFVWWLWTADQQGNRTNVERKKVTNWNIRRLVCNDLFLHFLKLIYFCLTVSFMVLHRLVLLWRRRLAWERKCIQYIGSEEKKLSLVPISRSHLLSNYGMLVSADVSTLTSSYRTFFERHAFYCVHMSFFWKAEKSKAMKYYGQKL